MESELGRKILSWYSRFDLTTGLMSENETALSKDWFQAAERYYQEQCIRHPDSIDYKIEANVATHRAFCVNLASLFSRFGRLTPEMIRSQSQIFREHLETWHKRLDPIFKDRHYQVWSFDGNHADADDLFDPHRPGGLWQEPLFTFNFMRLDWLAMSMMFKYKLALALGEPLPVELWGLALEACRTLEAVERWPESPVESVLRGQACLGIASLFLPRDERYTTWCRTKLAKIESLG